MNVDHGSGITGAVDHLDGKRRVAEHTDSQEPTVAGRRSAQESRNKVPAFLRIQGRPRPPPPSLPLEPPRPIGLRSRKSQRPNQGDSMQRGTFPKKSVRSPEAVAMSRHWVQSSAAFSLLRLAAPHRQPGERSGPSSAKVSEDQRPRRKRFSRFSRDEAPCLPNARGQRVRQEVDEVGKGARGEIRPPRVQAGPSTSRRSRRQPRPPDRRAKERQREAQARQPRQRAGSAERRRSTFYGAGDTPADTLPRSIPSKGFRSLGFNR